MTGCAGGWNPKDPFNNPTENPKACAKRSVPAPKPYDPYTGNRPSEIPKGWRWQVVILEVRALEAVELTGPNAKPNEYCVPFAVHVYGRADYLPALTIFDKGAVRKVPYDSQQNTPWMTYFVLGYDPDSPRIVAAVNTPKYQIELLAKYLYDLDVSKPGRVEPPKAFACSMALGNTRTIVNSKIVLSPRPGNDTAICNINLDAWNN